MRLKHSTVKKTAILRDRSIMSSANGGWNVISKEWTFQYAVLWPIAFASESLSNLEIHYINIEWETLDISHGLEGSHH